MGMLWRRGWWIHTTFKPQLLNRHLSPSEDHRAAMYKFRYLPTDLGGVRSGGIPPFYFSPYVRSPETEPVGVGELKGDQNVAFARN